MTLRCAAATGITDVKVQYHVDKIGMELDVAAGLRRGVADYSEGWLVAVTFNTRGLNVNTTTDGTYEILSHPLRVGKNEVRIQG